MSGKGVKCWIRDGRSGLFGFVVRTGERHQHGQRQRDAQRCFASIGVQKLVDSSFFLEGSPVLSIRVGVRRYDVPLFRKLCSLSAFIDASSPSTCLLIRIDHRVHGKVSLTDLWRLCPSSSGWLFDFPCLHCVAVMEVLAACAPHGQNMSFGCWQQEYATVSLLPFCSHFSLTRLVHGYSVSSFSARVKHWLLEYEGG